VMGTAKLLNISIVDLCYENPPALPENGRINEHRNVNDEKINDKEKVLDDNIFDQEMYDIESLKTDEDFINEENILGSFGRASPRNTFPCMSKIPNNQESSSNSCSASVGDAMFSQKKTLQKHIANLPTHNSKDLFSCEKCGKTFKSKTTFNFHKLSHVPFPKVKAISKSSTLGDSNKFCCPICPNSYSRRDNLKQHMNIHNGLTPYKCLTCEEAFETRPMKNNHISKCVGNKGKNENTDLKDEHMVLEGTPVVQEIIGPLQTKKRSTTENSLKLHAEKLYKCPFCPTKFEHAGNIKRHVKNKHPEENFAAKESFDASDIKEKELLLIHKCKHCSKAFLKEKSLKTHVKMKHPDENINKPQDVNNAKEKDNNLQLSHKCTYCSNEFLWKKSLKKHVKMKHPDENINKSQEVNNDKENNVQVSHTCKYCSKSFLKKISLKSHVKSCKVNICMKNIGTEATSTSSVDDSDESKKFDSFAELAEHKMEKPEVKKKKKKSGPASRVKRVENSDSEEEFRKL